MIRLLIFLVLAQYPAAIPPPGYSDDNKVQVVPSGYGVPAPPDKFGREKPAPIGSGPSGAFVGYPEPGPTLGFSSSTPLVEENVELLITEPDSARLLHERQSSTKFIVDGTKRFGRDNDPDFTSQSTPVGPPLDSTTESVSFTDPSSSNPVTVTNPWDITDSTITSDPCGSHQEIASPPTFDESQEHDTVTPSISTDHPKPSSKHPCSAQDFTIVPHTVIVPSLLPFPDPDTQHSTPPSDNNLLVPIVVPVVETPKPIVVQPPVDNNSCDQTLQTVEGQPQAKKPCSSSKNNKVEVFDRQQPDTRPIVSGCDVTNPLACNQHLLEICNFRNGTYRCECPPNHSRTSDGRCLSEFLFDFVWFEVDFMDFQGYLFKKVTST